VAATNHGDDVADDGSGGRSNDADGAREGWQEAFACGIEEAFGEEACLELFEGQLDPSRSARLHGVSDELELAARFVDRYAAPDKDCEAVVGAKPKKLGLATEEDDGELGVGILEGEVDVAGRGRAAVGDLAFNPQVGVSGLDLAADAGDEGGDGPDATLGWLRFWGWRLRRFR
jgi:hypothetical protein